MVQKHNNLCLARAFTEYLNFEPESSCSILSEGMDEEIHSPQVPKEPFYEDEELGNWLPAPFFRIGEQVTEEFRLDEVTDDSKTGWGFTHGIKQLPVESRPRERLARYGSQALSTVELLAILLGNGTKNRSALTLAADLLAQFQSLQKLSEATLAELFTVKGIGLAKAVQLQAAFALIRRIPLQEESLYPTIRSPNDAFLLMASELSTQPVETISILLRDVRQRCIHREMIGKGTLTEVSIHPREIYHIAIRHRAHNLIVIHNHPSGDPSPSTQDLGITCRLIATGNLLGIELSDHLIIGRNSYTSFYQKRLCGFTSRLIY